MKLLITGACGHIGSYLIQNIHKIKKINEVLLIDNFNFSHLNILYFYLYRNRQRAILLI